MKSPVTKAIICFAFLLMFYAPAFAQYTKLFDFAGTTTGRNPYDALFSDGTFLYGMTFFGGIHNAGTLFKIKPNGRGYVKLLDFNGTNGGNPDGCLISDGTFLYGITVFGGTNNMGVIFKIKPDGSGYVKLLDFDGTNGSHPNGSLISDGTFLYGMTSAGGKYGNGYNTGTIFKIRPDGTGYVKLLDFDHTTNGSTPRGSFIFDGTFLYGMTEWGGTHGLGTLFKIKPDGSSYVKLLDFDDTTNGSLPYGGSLLSDGSFLYGMTINGGTYGYGTLYKIKPDGTGYIKLLDFDGPSNGSYPFGSLFYDGTFLYGMTKWGGIHNVGTLFKIKPDGSGYVKLLDFGTNGYLPSGSLISDGTFLYGMTEKGGTYDSGTIFKYCLQPSFSMDTLTACSSYSWNGKTYTSSGSYTDTMLTAAGCDSIVTLNLTINMPTSDSLLVTACESMISPSGKYAWDSTGYYMDTIPNSRGCDSILRIHFIKTATSDSFTITSCKSFVSPSGKYTWDSTGYYRDTIPNSKGCDSVLTIHLIKIPFLRDTVLIKSCDTVVSPSGRYIYRTTGIYSDTLVSQENCDSIITTRLTIKPLQLSITKSNNISCDTPYVMLSASGGDSYHWEPIEGLSNANVANPMAAPNATRTYYVTATNSFGCSRRDSIVVFVKNNDSLGFIPNVFTPDNDGYNDCFDVSKLTQFRAIELSIFNRWGNAVFMTTDPKTCWNGKDLSGQQVSPGVYYYILTGTSYCNQIIERHGTITLIR